MGRELTLARQRAGLTVREVARAVGIPASTAGDYFAGRHLPPPSQPGLLPRILRACGVTDQARLSDWMSALHRIRRGPGRRPAATPAPYRGLASFQPEDAAWFFGRVYESLGEEQRDITRRLFLRLVYVADDAPETRSSVRLAELRDWPGETTSPGEVLDLFVAERLITVDADTAQITHEALLTAWPLVRTWIDANREGLRVRRRLSDSARAWDEAGRDPAALLRGGQLALARDWAADPVNRASLGTLTRAPAF